MKQNCVTSLAINFEGTVTHLPQPTKHNHPYPHPSTPPASFSSNPTLPRPGSKRHGFRTTPLSDGQRSTYQVAFDALGSAACWNFALVNTLQQGNDCTELNLLCNYISVSYFFDLRKKPSQR